MDRRALLAQQWARWYRFNPPRNTAALCYKCGAIVRTNNGVELRRHADMHYSGNASTRMLWPDETVEGIVWNDLAE